MLGPVQRECICDPWMRRHGEHGPECAKAYKAKLLAPECPVCHGNAVVTVPVGPRDEFGNQHTEEAPCPACDEGDRQAVWRVHFDVLSRAALAPAPVTVEDFLPNPPSPCSGPVRNRASSLHDDPETDAEGRPVSGVEPSLVPTRSPISPGASASPASEASASAVAPGRRSNLQGRDAA